VAEFCGDKKSSYRQDQAIFATNFRKKLLIAFLIFLIVFPLLGFGYVTYLAIMIGITIIAAHGMNILTGFTGLISLGHAAFIGVGAYSSALLVAKLGVPFLLALPAAGAITSIVGMLFGLPSLRIKGLYLAMATLSAQVVLHFLMVNWERLTGGVYGFVVPTANIGPLVLDTDVKYYYLVVTIATIATLSTKQLFRTKNGRAYVAIRDRDIAAEVIGVSLFKYKLQSFGIGSFYAGVAGSLLAHYLSVITPEHFPLSLSIEYLAIIIVGGLGSVLGSILGASFIILLPEFLNEVVSSLGGLFPNAAAYLPYVKMITFGFIIVAFIIFEPKGLAEIYERVKKYFKLWPYAY